MLQDKRIAIIGIGYIGQNIINYLESLNIKVTAITRKNINTIEKEKFDYIINTAGNSGDFREHLIETIDSNINLNSYILKNAKIKYSYIYLSSSRVYGFSNSSNTIFDEKYINNDDHLDLDFIYDGSKKLAESLLLNYSKDVNYNIGILRLSNVYGNFNNLDDATLIKKIIRYKKENRYDLKVNQNKNSTKDFIYIDDVIESILEVMVNLKKTDIYNLAYGESYSLEDISKILDLEIATQQTIEPIYSNISNEKIKKEFNIKLKCSFEDGLKIILQG